MARGRERGLSEADQAAWAALSRLVRPLRGKRARAGRAVAAQIVAPVAAPAATPEPAASATPGAVPPAKPPARGEEMAALLRPGQAPPGLDRATWRRLAEGRMPIERRLDLHGRSVEAAHRALIQFLHAASADGVRHVEIITGIGRGDGQGRIRAELPHWLEMPGLRGLILACVPAHARNPGALRVLLRRRG